MHKEIVINSTSNEVRVALLEEHEVVEFSMERADALSVVGNVYKGKVTAVRPGLQAAFVDIGMEKAGFLHVSDLIHDDSQDGDNGGGRRSRRRGRDNLRPIESMLKEGDEILVQVTKDIIGTKGPRLTADVSLPGRFMVMMPKGDHVGVSRKIDDRKERGRLKDLLASLKQPEEGGAFIIRTAAIGIEKKMLERDMDYLRGLWKELKEKTHSMPAPAPVHQDVGLIVGMVRDIFKDDVDSLVVDSRQDYQELMSYVKNFSPELRERIHFYDGEIPIFDRYGIEAELKKSLDRKVWMKRGGFLVIEQTEALVAIDVNTGRFTGKKNQAETILKTNMLAAKEVARQLRLRDIGGIIVIDFIDMDSEDHKRKVLGELRTHLKRDRSRNKTFGISDLGLVEMSRQRVQESLKDRLSDDCPFCRGSGQVLSVDTLANKVELLLTKLAATRSEKGVQVRANPTLALTLMTERANALQNLSRDTNLPIDVVDDPRLHREEFQILSVEGGKDLVAEIEKARTRGEPRLGREQLEDSDRRGSSRGRRGRGDDADGGSKDDDRGSRRGSRRGRGRDDDRRGRGRGRDDDRRGRGRDDDRGGRGRGRDDEQKGRSKDDGRQGRSQDDGRSRRGRGDDREQPSRGREPEQTSSSGPERQEASDDRGSRGDSSSGRGDQSGGGRRRRRRGRRGRRRDSSRSDSSRSESPRSDSPRSESSRSDSPRQEDSSPPTSSSSRDEAPSRGRDDGGSDDGARTRRRSRRRRNGESSDRPRSQSRRSADDAPEQAKEKRAAGGDESSGGDESRGRSRRSGRRSSSRGSSSRSSSQDSSDSSREESTPSPDSSAVARPEDYVRAIPAGESDAKPAEPQRSEEKREAPASSSSSDASDRSGSSHSSSKDDRSRRRRRRVRRKGIPTRALGKDPKERDS